MDVIPTYECAGVVLPQDLALIDSAARDAPLYELVAKRVSEMGDGPLKPCPASESPPRLLRRSLHMVTYNVMMDFWRGSPYKHVEGQPALRYAYIRDKLVEMEVDIVCLNEVTPTFIFVLLSHSTLRRRFYFSSSLAGCGPPSAPSTMGNLILVNKDVCAGPPQFHRVSLPKLPRPVVIAAFDSLHVASTHLSALTLNVQRRQMQLHHLSMTLPRDVRVVITGDLNFHKESENDIIPSGFRDVQHPHFTFDADSNPMLQVLWPLGFERRRMRLDRVLLRGTDLECTTPKLCFNQRIGLPRQAIETPSSANPATSANSRSYHPSIFQRLSNFAGYGFPPIETYLMPSDHYGLEFSVSVPSISP